MTEMVLIWVLGLTFSIHVGKVFVRELNQRLKKYIHFNNNPNRLTSLMGCFERVIYTSLFCFNQYTIIAGLFALLAAQKILAIKRIERDNKVDNRFAQYTEYVEITNVYFISSFTSLGFAILSGIIIKFLLR